MKNKIIVNKKNKKVILNGIDISHCITKIEIDITYEGVSAIIHIPNIDTVDIKGIEEVRVAMNEKN